MLYTLAITLMLNGHPVELTAGKPESLAACAVKASEAARRFPKAHDVTCNRVKAKPAKAQLVSCVVGTDAYYEMAACRGARRAHGDEAPVSLD